MLSQPCCASGSIGLQYSRELLVGAACIASLRQAVTHLRQHYICMFGQSSGKCFLTEPGKVRITSQQATCSAESALLAHACCSRQLLRAA